MGLALAERGWDVIDLDSEIEESVDRSCEDIIAEDGEARFRALEQNTLAEIIGTASETPRIIIVGAGCNPIPDEPICIWLRRPDWESAAATERSQVWPDLSIDEELERMRSERSPIYAAAADLVFNLERGAELEHAAVQLESLLNWTLTTGDLSKLSYIVVPSPELLHRAECRVRQLGMAGLEIRSDIFDAVPKTTVPFIASLRHDDPSWLKSAGDAAMWDIDLAYINQVTASGVLDVMPPRPLILSSHMNHSPKGVAILADARNTFREEFPKWAEKVIIKYAPHNVTSFGEIATLLNQRGKLGLGGPHILLPQGRRWAWLRPILGLRSNFLNYVGLGVSTNRGDVQTLPPWDLRDWLPHLGLNRGSRFDALIGDPADHSQGDIYHRRAAERVGLNVGYIRVQVDVDELEHALALLKQLGLFNLSVTSPLKIHAAEVVDNDAPKAINTLTWRGNSWHGWDTDSAGMRAALQRLEERGIAPGTIAIIGRGGVSPALVRVIVESGWTLAFHAGARQGWTSAPHSVDLVVNAAGDRDVVYQGPPESVAWLDLHYVDVREPPEVRVHLNGDTFFVAQADAQRHIWGYPFAK